MLVIENCNSLSDLRQKLIDGEEVRTARQEPCEYAISRQAALDEAFEIDTKEYGRIDVVGVDAIDALPPVNPQPKTGHWIWCVGSHKCSNCEEYTCFSHKELLRYCPNCGAKMESEG